MEGAGTRENILTEILTSRSNQQIENIKVIYKKCKFDKNFISYSYFDHTYFVLYTILNLISISQHIFLRIL